MRSQPNRNYVSNDEVITPPVLAQQIVEYFHPEGKLLEPCCGTGSFLKYMAGADWCEIERGRDFLKYENKVDWIITNPPWSKFRVFLLKSMEVSDNVVFLVTINHLWTKARLRDINENGFYIAEILTIDTPDNFPQSGFQLGVIHLKKGYNENIKFTQGFGFNEMASQIIQALSWI